MPPRSVFPLKVRERERKRKIEVQRERERERKAFSSDNMWEREEILIESL
jgi:hypothetical protein